MDIITALNQLDKNNDDYWTADGAPRVDVVSKMVGKEVKRQDITDAAPGFSREANQELDMSIEDIMQLTPDDFRARPELFDYALNKLDVWVADMDVHISETKKIREKRHAAANEIRELKMRSRPQGSSVLQFIKSQNDARASRAAKAQAFIAAGTTAGDVVAALQSKSRLDQAMSSRKAAPGSTRPDRLPLKTGAE